ncbi:MAG TPA: hypothetical protein VFI31_09570 [Pirellulales bacterium]|nr:hypothetical protein [Pirellulales bacterium]
MRHSLQTHVKNEIVEAIGVLVVLIGTATGNADASQFGRFMRDETYVSA